MLRPTLLTPTHYQHTSAKPSRRVGLAFSAKSDGLHGVSSGEASASRGVLVLPGLANNTEDYVGLRDHLQDRGLAVKVVQVKRSDWSRNAGALTDINWWQGTLKPRPALDWYLTRINTALDELKREVDGAPITLLGHSAGGWLGRVFMLEFGVTGIDRYITLGTPHAPPPAGVQGVVDQTRGILSYCQDACPGAHHPEVKYVTISGNKVKGVKLNAEGTWLQKLAGVGYQQVCGAAEVWGDCIVPKPSAHLEGAINVDIDDCFHSPLGARLKFFGPWYGSDEMVDQWMHWVTDDWEALQPGDYHEHVGQPTTKTHGSIPPTNGTGAASANGNGRKVSSKAAAMPAAVRKE